MTPNNLGGLSGILSIPKCKMEVVITLIGCVIVRGSIVKHWQTSRKLMKDQYTDSGDFSDLQIIKDQVRSEENKKVFSLLPLSRL